MPGGTLVDTNVVFDFLSQDAEWFDWSAAMLTDAAERGPIVINPVIYAELSVRYDRVEDVDLALPSDFPTSSLARMRRSRASPCSPAMRAATERIFPGSS
jgi:predicted nucleic acid-binding protein